MTPRERETCQAALEAAERTAQALRAALAADEVHGALEPSSEASAALRIKDVTAIYGVSDKTARRWAKDRGFRRGGVLFIRRDAIESART